MMTNEERIREVVRGYQDLVSDPDEMKYDALFADDDKATLISIGKVFTGKQAIYRDFLIGGIQKAYSRIELINDGLTVNQIDDHTAVVIFRYHTECIRRDSGEAYGIRGVETQLLIKEGDLWKIMHVHYSKV